MVQETLIDLQDGAEIYLEAFVDGAALPVLQQLSDAFREPVQLEPGQDGRQTPIAVGRLGPPHDVCQLRVFPPGHWTYGAGIPDDLKAPDESSSWRINIETDTRLAAFEKAGHRQAAPGFAKALTALTLGGAVTVMQSGRNPGHVLAVADPLQKSLCLEAHDTQTGLLNIWREAIDQRLMVTSCVSLDRYAPLAVPWRVAPSEPHNTDLAALIRDTNSAAA